MDSIINALVWIFIFEVFSFALFPAISIICKGLEDRGFAISKFLGILLASYLSWILGSIHVLPFTQLTTCITACIVIFTGIIITFFRTKARNTIFEKMTNKAKEQDVAITKSQQFFNTNPIIQKIFSYILKQEELLSQKEEKHLYIIIIVEEILFLLSFVVWVYLRGIVPNIMGTEKFMDFGIMNAILKSSYFPPHDMWLAGMHLNYYYYGQYIFSYITKLSGIASSFTYNFSIATIFSLVITLTTSLVFSLTKKIYAALIAGFVLTCAGNLDFITTWLRYLLTNHSLKNFSFWYPTSTRLIPYTINEFPIYSFVVSDLHAHVTDIPVVLISLLLSLNILYKKNLENADIILSAFILGVIAVTNSWDALIYASVLGIVLIISATLHGDTEFFFHEKTKATLSHIRGLKGKKLQELLMHPVVLAFINTIFIGVIGALCFIPFYVSFKAPVDGIGFNTMAHSNVAIELSLFGFFLFFILSLFFLFIYLLSTKKKFHISDLFVTYLVILGIICIAAPEFIYLKDIFYKANPPYFRANTVFKLYYQAFLLFSLVVGYTIARWNDLFKLTDIKKWLKAIVGGWDILVLLFLCSVFAYTYQAVNEGYLNLQTPATSPLTCKQAICIAPFKTDDGTNYIQTDYPDDYQIITWLTKHANNDSVIAEAVGDSYTYYGRISANTGLAAVLGWPNHEFQWRNTYSYSDARIKDMFDLYSTNDAEKAIQIIQKYHISYIIVGDQERQKYTSINEQLLKNIGQIVYTTGNSYVIDTTKI